MVASSISLSIHFLCPLTASISFLFHINNECSSHRIQNSRIIMAGRPNKRKANGKMYRICWVCPRSCKSVGVCWCKYECVCWLSHIFVKAKTPLTRPATSCHNPFRPFTHNATTLFPLAQLKAEAYCVGRCVSRRKWAGNANWKGKGMERQGKERKEKRCQGTCCFCPRSWPEDKRLAKTGREDQNGGKWNLSASISFFRATENKTCFLVEIFYFTGGHRIQIPYIFHSIFHIHI